jgi:hypothetical protein
VLAAFNGADGSTDTQFGSNGQTEISFPSGGIDIGVNNLLIQPDGKIVVNAELILPGSGYAFGLARFLDDDSDAIHTPTPPTGSPPGQTNPVPPVPPALTGGGTGAAPVLRISPAGTASAPAIVAGGTTPATKGNTGFAQPVIALNALLTTPGAPSLGGSIVPEGSQTTLNEGQLAATTTGLRSLDLTYFGSGGSEKVRSDTAGNAILDAAFSNMADEV